MKHVKIYENFKNDFSEREKSDEFYVEELRRKCNELNNQYSLSRNDELQTKIQQYQVLINKLNEEQELDDRDYSVLDQIDLEQNNL